MGKQKKILTDSQAASLPCSYPRARISQVPSGTSHIPYQASRGGTSWEIEVKNGLPSADRNNKATLLLTGPFHTAKSSAKDLTPLVLKLQSAKYHDTLREPWRNRLLRH